MVFYQYFKQVNVFNCIKIYITNERFDAWDIFKPLTHCERELEYEVDPLLLSQCSGTIHIVLSSLLLHQTSFWNCRLTKVEAQFSLSGLSLHTQPIHSSEQHTRSHLKFSSHFTSHQQKAVFKLNAPPSIIFLPLSKVP